MTEFSTYQEEKIQEFLKRFKKGSIEDKILEDCLAGLKEGRYGTSDVIEKFAQSTPLSGLGIATSDKEILIGRIEYVSENMEEKQVNTNAQSWNELSSRAQNKIRAAIGNKRGYELLLAQRLLNEGGSIKDTRSILKEGGFPAFNGHKTEEVAALIDDLVSFFADEIEEETFLREKAESLGFEGSEFVPFQHGEWEAVSLPKKMIFEDYETSEYVGGQKFEKVQIKGNFDLIHEELPLESLVEFDGKTMKVMDYWCGDSYSKRYSEYQVVLAPLNLSKSCILVNPSAITKARKAPTGGIMEARVYQYNPGWKDHLPSSYTVEISKWAQSIVFSRRVSAGDFEVLNDTLELLCMFIDGSIEGKTKYSYDSEPLISDLYDATRFKPYSLFVGHRLFENRHASKIKEYAECVLSALIEEFSFFCIRTDIEKRLEEYGIKLNPAINTIDKIYKDKCNCLLLQSEVITASDIAYEWEDLIWSQLRYTTDNDERFESDPAFRIIGIEDLLFTGEKLDKWQDVFTLLEWDENEFNGLKLKSIMTVLFEHDDFDLCEFIADKRDVVREWILNEEEDLRPEVLSIYQRLYAQNTNSEFDFTKGLTESQEEDVLELGVDIDPSFQSGVLFVRSEVSVAGKKKIEEGLEKSVFFERTGEKADSIIDDLAKVKPVSFERVYEPTRTYHQNPDGSESVVIKTGIKVNLDHEEKEIENMEDTRIQRARQMDKIAARIKELQSQINQKVNDWNENPLNESKVDQVQINVPDYSIEERVRQSLENQRQSIPFQQEDEPESSAQKSTNENTDHKWYEETFYEEIYGKEESTSELKEISGKLTEALNAKTIQEAGTVESQTEELVFFPEVEWLSATIERSEGDSIGELRALLVAYNQLHEEQSFVTDPGSQMLDEDSVESWVQSLPDGFIEFTLGMDEGTVTEEF